MSSTKENIRSAAARNREILKGLADTDYASAALRQSTRYLDDLQQELARNMAEIEQLKMNTVKERKEHEKYQQSHFRRFAHKARGKKAEFEQKAAKEEREYFEAISLQKQAEDRCGVLEQYLQDGKAAHSKLEADDWRHQTLKKELDALYNSIFRGRTAEFPEEDDKEYRLNGAQTHYRQVQGALQTERQAVRLMQEAMGYMLQVLKEMKEALSRSQAELFGAGFFNDFYERNALERAQSGLSKVGMLFDQAQRVQTEIKDIGVANVTLGPIISEIFFDSVYSDVAMHNAIKQAEGECKKLAARLDKQIKDAVDRQSDIEKDLTEAKEQLEGAREELQRVRQQAFEQVATASA